MSSRDVGECVGALLIGYRNPFIEIATGSSDDWTSGKNFYGARAWEDESGMSCLRWKMYVELLLAESLM